MLSFESMLNIFWLNICSSVLGAVGDGDGEDTDALKVGKVPDCLSLNFDSSGAGDAGAFDAIETISDAVVKDEKDRPTFKSTRRAKIGNVTCSTDVGLGTCMFFVSPAHYLRKAPPNQPTPSETGAIIL